MESGRREKKKQPPPLSDPASSPMTGGTKTIKRPKVSGVSEPTGYKGSGPTVVARVPAPPAGWDRCHVYLPAKRRFCRQDPVVEVCVPPYCRFLSGSKEEEEGCSRRIARYCGNHRHVAHQVVESNVGSIIIESARNSADPHEGTISTASTVTTTTTTNPHRRRRVPCPVDPTHTVWEDQVEKHSRKCPKLLRQQIQQAMGCYRRDCNRGGFGNEDFRNDDGVGSQAGGGAAGRTPNDDAADWAAALARRVMRMYSRDAADGCGGAAVGGGIRLADLATPDLVEELRQGADHYRIKTGGPKHLRQHASLVGHLRRAVKDAFEATQHGTQRDGDRAGTDQDADAQSLATSSSLRSVTVLEMGAGRGITGLLVAGVMNSATQSEAASPPPSSRKAVELVLVDRGNSRSKADTVLRRALTVDPSPHLDLRLRSWRRVICDLDHLHVPTLLDCHDPHEKKVEAKKDGPSSASTFSRDDEGNTRDAVGDSVNSPHKHQPPRLVAIAKHLCGSGTDVALKSLVDVRDRVRACAFATCCHGLCTWDDYVGRDYLGRVMTRNVEAEAGPTQAPPVSTFGKEEFTLLARWSAGTASCCSQSQHGRVRDEELPTEHSSSWCNVDNDDPFNVAQIAAAVGVEPAELGRACQRLIDFGRREFLQSSILAANAESPTSSSTESMPTVELVHYVPPQVTPQNALLLGWR